MEFCTITPTAGLERWGTALSRRHLVLAQQLYNADYMRYYADRKRAGDFLILDNGAYENTRPLDSTAYFNYIKALSPDVAVLPDILMSPWRETISVALRFLDEFAPWLEQHGYRTQWMFVPQTTVARNNEDGFTPKNEFFQSLQTVVNDGRVGKYITYIGLGRYLHTAFINLPGKGFRRANLAKEIKGHQGLQHLKLHALGMAAGNLDEMKALRDAEVESIDSSAPVWRGWNNTELADPINKWASFGTPCDFSAQLSQSETVRENQIKWIEHNLEVIRKCLA